MRSNGNTNTDEEMNDKDIAFRKMLLSLNSLRELEQQDRTMKELKDAAFEMLLENAGSDKCDWRDMLICEYASELTEAYVSDQAEVYAMIDDLWESPYYDERSGLEYDYHDWAEAFATDASVQMYHDFICQMEKLMKK